ncbi:cytidylyltransferase [Candidatus Nitrosopumilus salaria BD31]|uniref:Cytidylyltransferase n=1 Tax=Candidatus Nitrosopumilus salarius BD31 TaxID=859350 RepID=I3D5E0_9ARCH|nr:cytidylyltransferase [Candidatus Nitrosopumilus salaria BD31]
MINRLKTIPKIDNIILATTTKNEDSVLIKIAKQNNIDYFQGKTNDVLNRYYECAKEFDADIIIRITADCPLLDPKLIQKMLNFYLNNNYDYLSNTLKPTFPDGLDVEIFSFKTLTQAHKLSKLKSELEHVTPYIKNNPKKFQLFNYENKKDLSGIRLTVDEINDLTLIRHIFKKLKPKTIFSLDEILNVISSEPKLLQINQHIQRDSGYIKSLKNDRKIC